MGYYIVLVVEDRLQTSSLTLDFLFPWVFPVNGLSLIHNLIFSGLRILIVHEK